MEPRKTSDNLDSDGPERFQAYQQKRTRSKGRESGPTLHDSRSAPDLRKLEGWQSRKPQAPSILESLELHSVHEEPGKTGNQTLSDTNRTRGDAEHSRPKKVLTKVGAFFRRDSSKSADGKSIEKQDSLGGNRGSSSGNQHGRDGTRAWRNPSSIWGGQKSEDKPSNREKQSELSFRNRGFGTNQRVSRFSEANSLDASLHESQVSEHTSQGGSLRMDENGVSETSQVKSRRSFTDKSQILKKSSKALKRYTTHSVSRQSLRHSSTTSHAPGPQIDGDYPDTQNTLRSGLSVDWQREFYGKTFGELAKQPASRSEDQSSLRTGSSSGGGDSHSHYGRSTEKVPKGLWLPLIHPYSRARRDMNCLIAACLLYIAIVLPFEFCFNVHVQGYWLIADGIVTVIFMLDVVINFRTGFVQKGKREVKDGLRILKPATIVMDPAAIARRYLRGWFTIDVISSFPWDFLLFSSAVRKRYWILQVLRSLKILRIHRLTIVRSELRETWSAGQREFFEICGFFLLTLYFSHLCACLFVAVGKLQSDPQRWLDQTHYDDSGAAAVLADGPQIDIYIASMYFQMVSLATVGYGDIHAGITAADRAFMTVVDLFGAFLLAFIVGKISSLIILRRDRRYALRERFATLHAYVAREQLPEWLATRLMVHLSRQWSSQIIEFSEVELVKDMTDDLRSELLIHWWRKTIPSSALLPHKHGFLGLLLAKCKTQVFPARDVITKEGESVRQLWVLRAGQLAVSRSVSLDDLDILRGGVSDEDVTSDENEPPEHKDADVRQLTRITSYKRPEQRTSRLPTMDWAVDLDHGDQSDKALVTEMAAPGTIIGEAPLLLALSQKVLKDRAAKQAGGKGKKKLAVKAILQDVTVECKTECSLLVLLLDDLFEILDQYPSLAQKLKRDIIRAERHMQKSGAPARPSDANDGL